MDATVMPAVDVEVGAFLELARATVVHRYDEGGDLVLSLDNDTRLHVERDELLSVRAAA